uniref:Uncharacterized protein n=1 Tax=Amphimedon queenslandica TaxID=400682 RepID=A0A1X7TTS2_AMPQE
MLSICCNSHDHLDCAVVLTLPLEKS